METRSPAAIQCPRIEALVRPEGPEPPTTWFEAGTLNQRKRLSPHNNHGWRPPIEMPQTYCKDVRMIEMFGCSMGEIKGRPERPLTVVVSTDRRNTLPWTGEVIAMKRKYKRLGFTAAQSAELWDHWQQGEGLKSIGRALGKPSSCIVSHLRPSGGIRPRARKRSRLALTLAEREEISRGIAAGQSIRSIACSLGRSASTVSREINRNGGCVRYRAAGADKRAWDVARRPKACKLATYLRLRQAVARKLQRHWSPEQIAGWLKRRYADDQACHVSHETIYRSLFVQARGP